MSLTQGFISLRIEVHNMPNTTSTYEPLVLVDTADLPEEEWLEYRRRGIGGSDAAAILGVSPYDCITSRFKIAAYPLCLVYISIQQQNIAHSIITLSSAGYILSLRLPNKVKT